MIEIPSVIVWLVSGVLLVALAVSMWWRDRLGRISGDPRFRAVLVIGLAACLGWLVTGNLFTLLLLSFDVLLVTVTWLLTRRQKLLPLWIGVLVILLIVAKLPQSAISPAAWIGVSYLIFRLIHVALDARHDRIGDVTLPEMLIYALHPATLLAGPIDRVQHNVSEQRCEPSDSRQYINDGLWRIFVGLFKKIVLAGLCNAFITLHDLTRQPNQPQAIAWLWLIAYSLYLYFDFAGYSDIAIGTARLMKLRLPENFANPYFQPSLVRFWQAWHITLSTWLRDYIFVPLSRSLLKRSKRRYATLIMLVCHLTTMIACGLWHGLGTGFVAWGIWHGLGLFINSQLAMLRRRFNLPVLPAAIGGTITVSFVGLGWVFFSTNLATALLIFGRLFGRQ